MYAIDLIRSYLQVDEIGKFRLQQIKKNDGLSCVTRNESYKFNISYIELVQHVQFDTIIFRGLNEEVEIEVPTALFVNNTSNKECIGWIGGNFQPNLFSTRMLPYYPETEVRENASSANNVHICYTMHTIYRVTLGNAYRVDDCKKCMKLLHSYRVVSVLGLIFS